MSHTESAPALAEGVDTPTPPVRSSTLLSRSLRLWRTRIGAIFVLILVVLAIIGPWIAPHEPDEFVGKVFSSPGNGLLFGTDYLGQDVWSRFLYGGRSILFMAVVSTAIGVVVGVAIGLVAAYARNALDDILMRAMDVIMAFPQIMLALVAVSLLGAQDLADHRHDRDHHRTTRGPGRARCGATRGRARLRRGDRGHGHVAGADPSGELLPNILGPMMVEATLRLTYSIAVIAALAFLGLAPDPNGPNWGTMIKQNQLALATQPWGTLLPIIAIAVLTMGTGLIGDGIARTAAGIDRERGDE